MAEEPAHVYRTELEGVRAPLGVLLYLIRRDNLDIYDIPIARITKEYLDYLDLMEELHIELAGEFFVMAATLMRIKVQMLLRKDDMEEDPREGLVRSLLEYKKMVEAAKSLREMEEERLKVFKRPIPDREKEFIEESTLELNLYQLMRAFQKIISAFEEREISEIEPEIITMEERIDAILSALSLRSQVAFHELFSGSSSRLELIVTFMALLELIKLAKVKARQEGAFGSIWIYRAAGFENDASSPDVNEEGAGSDTDSAEEAPDV
ncbi:MAG: segregation/condensation protein A [Candidatus Latescibacteria bacterium]|nr:segregation/condensation protein A [Candidatus Latescibacterota bacterium]NIM21335.1 segregation/condensation protein A [Candidatus Latescibacterota bacterium]NIM65516.1 segregation/condensation protein A [Candidatus Latescibacterota bacterium]NIO01896.1 segregation/condensation protein A [Candidatus Latescibacterota bacterium]NIO28709.1 segregation/condensation protein A [Candidatus Latescibacterota bacterium]